MFGFIKKAATEAAENATGIDIDGDGKAGKTTKTSSGKKSGGFDLASVAGVASSFAFPTKKDGSVELDDGASMPVSSCKGNKKSLFVGINYTGSSAALRGCINDVNNIKALVTKNYGFTSDADHMLTLVDDGSGDKQPTRANIVAGMKWLIQGAKDGDSLFFHYSGHGGSQKDESPESDEIDGMDETLVPVDYTTAGMIVDDEIHAMLVAPLPKGVRVTAVMDCCHSGSIFDLPFTYKVDGSLDIIEIDNRKAAIDAAIKAGKALIDGDKMAAATHGANAVWNLVKSEPAEQRPVVIRKSLADVIQFSGCKDEQTSADAHIGGEHTGAMSWALIASLTEHGFDQTYTELLGNIRQKLDVKYSQVPQMSTGHKMHMASTKFTM